ncbi:flagellar brake protein [Vibrio sinensis]|uniref:Flagellar brake protein n=1 Tax=Vibrio sinensis TaxID=2302434 RepID=A0A3A6RFH8_9VIBR|nr:PilZ domain-containing protein [Vibrio sinensis]RJX75461.1 flagellar brake protein [Vibrio sinensis]
MPCVNESIDELLPLLNPGNKISVTLQFGPEDTMVFTSLYIGCKPERFMIIDLPTKVHEALLMRQVNNVSIIVRSVTSTKLGHIIAFKSSVLCLTTTPSTMLFVRLPRFFASKPIRSHERFSLTLPITLNANNIAYDATMIDFSVSGCALFVAGENELSKGTQINIDSAMSSLLPKDIEYHVVSINKEKQGHKLGIQFGQEILMNDPLKMFLLQESYSSSQF